MTPIIIVGIALVVIVLLVIKLRSGGSSAGGSSKTLPPRKSLQLDDSKPSIRLLYGTQTGTAGESRGRGCAPRAVVITRARRAARRPAAPRARSTAAARASRGRRPALARAQMPASLSHHPIAERFAKQLANELRRKYGETTAIDVSGARPAQSGGLQPEHVHCVAAARNVAERKGP